MTTSYDEQLASERRSVEAATKLEEYLRSADVLHTANLPLGGGGHPDKRLVVLEGSVSVLAKVCHTHDEERMARCEAAAWAFATELGWMDLVPATVWRELDLGAERVEGSVQLFLPAFKTATEAGATPASCGDTDIWRVAVFDALSRSTDRSENNWGFVETTTAVKLVDHGHAFVVGAAPTSPFIDLKRGQHVPAEILSGVEQFINGSDRSRLRQLLDDDAVDQTVERARTLVEDGRL